MTEPTKVLTITMWMVGLNELYSLRRIALQVKPSHLIEDCGFILKLLIYNSSILKFNQSEYSDIDAENACSARAGVHHVFGHYVRKLQE